MKLYYNPLSNYSQKVLMGFHEKGITYTPEIVSLMDPVARAAYAKINPLGKVPMLELADGYKIPESTIILEWAEQHQRGTKLIPDDPDLARRTRFHDRLADLYLANPMGTLFFDGRKPPEAREPKRVADAHVTLDMMYRGLDMMLEKSSWIVGEHFTMADCSHAPPLNYLRMLKPFDEHRHLTAYANRLFERPSWQKVMEELGPALAKMQALATEFESTGRTVRPVVSTSRQRTIR